MNVETVLDIADHAFLPALSLVLGGIGFWALGMRAMMVNVLGEDYITFAESKGLSPRRIFLCYGMRNALLPQVTALALALGSILSGAVLVEAIFNYPGLGGLLFASILGKDIFVIQGIVLMLILTLAIAVFVDRPDHPRARPADPTTTHDDCSGHHHHRPGSRGRAAAAPVPAMTRGSRRQLVVGLADADGDRPVRDRRPAGRQRQDGERRRDRPARAAGVAALARDGHPGPRPAGP